MSCCCRPGDPSSHIVSDSETGTYFPLIFPVEWREIVSKKEKHCLFSTLYFQRVIISPKLALVSHWSACLDSRLNKHMYLSHV